MILEERRKMKREEAEARQAEYDKLSIDQKIKRAKSRPGESKKEIARLMAKKTAVKKEKVVKKKKTPKKSEK